MRINALPFGAMNLMKITPGFVLKKVGKKEDNDEKGLLVTAYPSQVTPQGIYTIQVSDEGTAKTLVGYRHELEDLYTVMNPDNLPTRETLKC